MNYHKGFIAPLLLALVALILIGGGTYVYSVQKNQENQPATGSVTLPQATSTTQIQTPTTTTQIRSNEFSVLPSSGPFPLSVTFSFVTLDTRVSIDSETAYRVDFGDNSTEYGFMDETRCAGECRKFTVAHTYTTPGTHTATLIKGLVGMKYSNQAISTTTITVTSK